MIEAYNNLVAKLSTRDKIKLWVYGFIPNKILYGMAHRILNRMNTSLSQMEARQVARRACHPASCDLYNYHTLDNPTATCDCIVSRPFEEYTSSNNQLGENPNESK